MALLSREQLVKQSRERLGPVPVPVPSGGEVQINRVLGSVIRDWRLSNSDEKGNPKKSHKGKLAELFLCRVLLDADGSQMFTVDEVLADELDSLLSGEDLEYLTDVAYKLNGIGVERPEVLEKNSETTDAKESSAE